MARPQELKTHGPSAWPWLFGMARGERITGSHCTRRGEATVLLSVDY